jgi:hypothetical protein
VVYDYHYSNYRVFICFSRHRAEILDIREYYKCMRCTARDTQYEILVLHTDSDAQEKEVVMGSVERPRLESLLGFRNDPVWLHKAITAEIAEHLPLSAGSAWRKGG